MSKYLVKILTICAFAILLPLVVVGAALCVTEARGVTLTVAAAGIEGQFGGTESNVSIYIGNEKQEGSKITVKKNTDVTVTYEGVGYDFQGWYNGNYAEKKDTDEAVSDLASYTFTLRGNTVLTAVRNVKTYTITFSGKMDDGSDITTTPLTQTFEYNEQLPALEATQVGVAYTGWNDINSTATTGSKYATFDNKEITVIPVWSNQMLVKYVKAGGENIATAPVTQAELPYALLNGTDEAVVNALERGKAFDGWLYNTDKITSITEFVPEGYELVLQEKTSTYNIKIKYNAVSAIEDDITYNIEDGYSAYSKTRSGYEFKGFEYAGTVYAPQGNDYVNDGASLSSVIINTGDITVTAVWECEVKLGFILTVKAWYEDGGEWLAKANGGEWAKIEGLDVTFEDTATGYDLTDDIYEMFTNQFANFTKQEKDGGAPLSYKDIDYVNGNILAFVGNHGGRTRFARSEGDYALTFGTLIAALKSEGYTIDEIDGESITVCFMYA